MKDYKNKKKNGTNSTKGSEFKKFHPKTPADTSKTNDWHWYAPDTQIVKDVANLAFGDMLGNTVDMSIPMFSEDQFLRVPGILRINLQPALGAGNKATDALTVSSRLLYSVVRKANSGSSNYEAPDLTCYITGITSARVYLAELKRVYSAIRYFTFRNKYYGKCLVEAMGYSYDDLSTKLADFRAFINLSTLRLNSRFVPKGQKLYSRWKWLVENIFLDDNGHKAQTYLPVFEGYYKFDPVSSGTGSSLIFTAKPKTLMDLNALQNYFELLVEPLMNDDDIRTMSGDMLKAFGEGTALTEPVIDENFHTLPIYDLHMLQQISNAVCFDLTDTGGADPNFNNIVVQGTNGVLENRISAKGGYKAEFNAAKFYKSLSKYVINMENDEVSPEEVLVATRLQPVFNVIEGQDSEGQRETTVRMTACGSEFVTTFVIYTDPNDRTKNVEFTNTLPSMSSSAEFTVPCKISAFDYHPHIYVVDDYIHSPYWIFKDIICEFDNFTVVDFDKLANMHKVAILEEISSTDVTSMG